MPTAPASFSMASLSVKVAPSSASLQKSSGCMERNRSVISSSPERRRFGPGAGVGPAASERGRAIPRVEGGDAVSGEGAGGGLVGARRFGTGGGAGGGGGL